MSKRIFILDFEIISPLGCGTENLVSALKNNISAERPVSGIDTSGIPINIAAEVRESLLPYYSNQPSDVREIISHDRKFELLVSAYGIMEPRLKNIFDKAQFSRKGAVIGMGANVTHFDSFDSELLSALDAEDPFMEAVTSACLVSGKPVMNPYDLSLVFLADKLGIGGLQLTNLTACSASNQANILAVDALRSGDADLVLVGGTDSIINDLAYASFYKLGVLAPESEDGRSCKPFDKNRSGTLAGEAAGLIVLAGEEFVLRNKLEPRFELIAYGNTLDAYQITCPDPSGKGMKRALRQALRGAGVPASDIGYINLHGTGTRLNDQVELEALREVFGKEIEDIPVSSTKDRHGHAIAAAGIQELIILCLSMENGFIPCNRNLDKPIFDSGFKLLQNENLITDYKLGITANYSFGGVNTALVVGKV